MNNIVRILFLIVKNTKFDQEIVSLLCVKTKSGAHKQLTYQFQMRKHFCRHLHSSLISMVYTFRFWTGTSSTFLPRNLSALFPSTSSLSLTSVDPCMERSSSRPRTPWSPSWMTSPTRTTSISWCRCHKTFFSFVPFVARSSFKVELNILIEPAHSV